MIVMKEENLRFIFQLIKTRLDKQDKAIADLRTHLDTLTFNNAVQFLQVNAQIEALEEHAIMDSGHPTSTQQGGEEADEQ